MASDEFDDFGFTTMDAGTIAVMTGAASVELELEEEIARFEKLKSMILKFLDKLEAGDGDYISWPKSKRTSDIERFKKKIIEIEKS